MTFVKKQKAYFVSPFEGEYQVREDHEVLYGIPSGSGFCKSFKRKAEALAYAQGRNDGLFSLEAQSMWGKAKP